MVGFRVKGTAGVKVCGDEIISCFLPQRVAAYRDVILCGDLVVCKWHPFSLVIIPVEK